MKIDGIDVIDENFKFSRRLLFITIIAVSVSFCIIYSLYVTIITSDFDALMKVGFGVGIAITGMPRMSAIIFWQKKIRELFVKIELTYKMTSTAKGCDVLAANLRVFRLVGKCVTIAYIVAAALFISPPALYYIFYGKRILVTEIYVPGVDHKTISGFAFLTAIHSVTVAAAAILFLSFDVMIICFSYFILPLNKLLKIQLEELTEFLQNNDMKIARNKLKFKKHFKEIVLSHRFIQEYIQDCKDLFEFLFFVCICGAFVSNTSSLYLVIVMKWIASYGTLIVLICQVFYHCVVGFIYQSQVSEIWKKLSIVTSKKCIKKFQNEELSDMIWNFPWYSLPLDLQKDFLFIMMNVARSSEINLFYIGPLNLETFVTVSLNIICEKKHQILMFLNFQLIQANYTYLLILIEFGK
jgi:hypothetical protein